MEENGTASRGASDVTHAPYTDRPEADGEEEAPVDDSPYYTVSKSSTSSSSSSSTSSQTKQPRSSSRLSARRSRQAEAERSASSTADIATNGGSSGGDDDGAAATAGGAAVPLWRQLRAASDEARRKSPLGAKDREAKLAKQQRILQHIACTRAEQDLPPVFAILRGPTLRPYRMEELSLTLGRVTPHHRVPTHDTRHTTHDTRHTTHDTRHTTSLRSVLIMIVVVSRGGRTRTWRWTRTTPRSRGCTRASCTTGA
jgi:hypothetical protein